MFICLSKTPTGDAPPPPKYLGQACRGMRDQRILHLAASIEDISLTFFELRVALERFGTTLLAFGGILYPELSTSRVKKGSMRGLWYHIRVHAVVLTFKRQV